MKELNHVAIIVDGNGRWAKEKGKTRSDGHLEGSKNLEKIILYVARNTNIKYLSLYVFSTENFNRPKKEVDYLMDLFMKWFSISSKKYKKENIKVIFSGRREPLSDEVYNTMKKFEEKTKDNTGLIVNFCLNYGGRAEIVDACKIVASEVKNGLIDIESIDEEYFSTKFYNSIPDVDFMIRTSGEQRLSNFLLWENSYAEFLFVDTYFPDFNEIEFKKAIDVYYSRDRRFGKIV